MDKNKYDVFISYSRKDYVDENNVKIPDNAVSKIKEILNKNQITYWFDEDGIYHGDNFAEKIASNIEKSLIVLFLSSENSNDSKWTSKEIAAATEWKKKIIPIRLDKSPYNKSVMLYIADLDFVEYYKDPDSSAQTILESINNFKAEIERNRVQEELQREQKIKEKNEKELAEKRKQEQIELYNEIEHSINIIRISEEALERQRPELLKQINTLDDKIVRKKLHLLLEQSNQSAFEERQKSHLLLNSLEELKRQIQTKIDEELNSGKYILRAEAEQKIESLQNEKEQEKETEIKKQADKYHKEIKKLEDKCTSLEADREKVINGAKGDLIKKHQQETKRLLQGISEEQKKIKEIKIENDENKARVEILVKKKKRLHVIYSLLLVCSICISSLCLYLYLDSQSWYSHYQDRYYEKEEECRSLNDNNEALSRTISTLSSTLEKIGKATPFIINNIEIKNADEAYGATIYSKSTTYLTPKLTIFSLIDGSITLDVKLYTPDGLSKGSTSPKSCTFNSDLNLKKNAETDEELSGWGSEEKGNWKAGGYRYEFYYKGVCIGSKSFTIY